MPKTLTRYSPPANNAMWQYKLSNPSPTNPGWARPTPTRRGTPPWKTRPISISPLTGRSVTLTSSSIPSATSISYPKYSTPPAATRTAPNPPTPTWTPSSPASACNPSSSKLPFIHKYKNRALEMDPVPCLFLIAIILIRPVRTRFYRVRYLTHLLKSLTRILPLIQPKKLLDIALVPRQQLQQSPRLLRIK